MARHEARDRNGSFAQRINDDDIIAAWLDDPSVRRMARRLECSERQVRFRLARLRERNALPQSNPDVEREGKISQLGASVPTELHGAKLRELSVNLWGVAAKNAEGELITQGLDGIRAKYAFDTAASFTAVPYESPIRAYKPPNAVSHDCERVFIWGDTQIGFWAELDVDDPQKIRFAPFHDLAAIDVSLQALAHYQPHRLVVVGDFLDFPQLSRFQQEPQWAQTMQASIQEAYELLAKMRATVGDACKIDFIPGNHETRMQRAITNNNPALYNLRRPGERHAVYSVPSLLWFDRLGIECAAEYPSGEVWLRKADANGHGIVVTHADPAKKDMRADAIHGHLVLPSHTMRQIFFEDGPRTYQRLCVSGCGNYSDTGDKVRLTRSNTPSGRSRMSAVQSFGTVEIYESGARCLRAHLITNGAAIFDGRLFSARQEGGES